MNKYFYVFFKNNNSINKNNKKINDGGDNYDENYVKKEIKQMFKCSNTFFFLLGSEIID